MKKYTLPYFGELDLTNEDNVFIASASFDEKDFEIWIEFDSDEPSAELIKRIEQFLLQLPSHLEKVKHHLGQDLSKTSGFTASYISFFKETIEENGDTNNYVDENNANESIEQQLVKQLYLLRMCIYPDSNNFAVLDYTIDDSYTDELLVVYLTEKGELDGMSIES